MAHLYEGPKDKTNPGMYIPIAIVSVLIVAIVFASGVMRGLIHGEHGEPLEQRETEEKEVVNVKALAQPTDELVSQGKMLYSLNCASCHGDDGYGDGEKGVSLNPKPRNFHDAPEQWKNGATVAGMWKTLQEGIAGGSMSSYALMPPEERIAIIHYIRSAHVEEPPEVGPDDIAALPGPGGGSSSGGGAVLAAQDTGPRIPVRLAMNLMKRPESEISSTTRVPEALEKLPGHGLFGTHCASCHGEAGQGKESGHVLTSYPYVRTNVPPLQGAQGPWVADQESFTRLLTKSLQGRAMHGFSTLSKQELEDLRAYTVALSKLGGGG